MVKKNLTNGKKESGQRESKIMYYDIGWIEYIINEFC